MLTCAETWLSAKRNYTLELEEKQRQKEEKKQELQIKRKTVSKRKAKETLTVASKRARKTFFEKQKAKLG